MPTGCVRNVSHPEKYQYDDSVLQGCDAALVGSRIPTFRDSVVSLSAGVGIYSVFVKIWTSEDEDSELLRNDEIRLPTDATSHPRITEFSSTVLRKILKFAKYQLVGGVNFNIM